MCYTNFAAVAVTTLAVGAAMVPKQANAANTVAAVSATKGPWTRDGLYVGGVLGTVFNAGATDWQGYGFSQANVDTLSNKAASNFLAAGGLAG